MDDIFGKVAAILFAAIVFTGIPFLYMAERAKSAEQMYLMEVNTEFVDSICNTGFLTMDMYEQLCREVSAVSGIYEIHLLREQKEIVLEDGTYTYVSAFSDESDILEQLKKEDSFWFERGDYVRSAIVKKKGLFEIPWIKDDTVNVFYGGTVRYEDF